MTENIRVTAVGPNNSNQHTALMGRSLPLSPRRPLHETVTPCHIQRGRQAMWDLADASLDEVDYALNSCGTCRQFSSCSTNLQRQLQDSKNPPRAEIVAGRLFRHTGTEITTRKTLKSYLDKTKGKTKGMATRAAQRDTSPPTSDRPTSATFAPAPTVRGEQLEFFAKPPTADSPATAQINAEARLAAASTPRDDQLEFFETTTAA